VHEDQFEACEALIAIAISIAAVGALVESCPALIAAWLFRAAGAFMGFAGFLGRAIRSPLTQLLGYTRFKRARSRMAPPEPIGGRAGVAPHPPSGLCACLPPVETPVSTSSALRPVLKVRLAAMGVSRCARNNSSASAIKIGSRRMQVRPVAPRRCAEHDRW
jgi:hypothetical protein